MGFWLDPEPRMEKECSERDAKKAGRSCLFSMLKKKNRADRKDIDSLFKKANFLVSSDFTFKFILTNKSTSPRISFIAPKSIAKLAVKRNLLRRVGYNVLKKYIKEFPMGLVGVFVFKRFQDDRSIIENEIKNILNKIN